MLFDSWTSLGRVALAAVLAYVALILFVRLSGKRTLAKWNAFDLVVTIAFGSTLGTVILSNQVSVTEGVVAFAMLVLLQYAVTTLSIRIGWFEKLIKASPALLVHRGQYQEKPMHQHRVTHSEVRAALRGHGAARVEDVDAVVLETDGSITVIDKLPDGQLAQLSAMNDVKGLPATREETQAESDT